MKDLFLDTNAHVPLHPKALKAYVDFNNSKAGHGNPSSPSIPGREAATALEEARGRIAELIGAEKPEQIVFTTSCTQACQWIGRIVLGEEDPPSWRSVDMSPIEHPAMSQAFNCTKYVWHVSPDGVVEFDDEEWREFGICIHMQNEIGTIHAQ